MEDGEKIVRQYVRQAKCPLNILMYVVDRCNYSCPYCYNRKPRHLVDADSEVFVKFLKSVRDGIGDRPMNVSLIGGEPTLHPDISDMVSEIRVIPNATVELLTNFSRPVEEYVRYLEDGVNVAASWHAAPNDRMNWGYVERMAKVPMRFFEANQVEVRIMMENDNWESSRAAFRALYPRYKRWIEISLLSNNDGTPYRYTKSQLEEFRQFIALTKYTREFFTVEYADGTTRQVSFNDMYLNPNVNFHLWRCNAGLDYLYVHVNGDVYNCQSYYEHGRRRLYNIVENGGVYEADKAKPCICSVDYCSCDFDVYKERVLGRGR